MITYPQSLTMVCDHCSERSGTPSTIDIDEISKKVGEMSGFARMNDGEADEEDLHAVV